MKIKLDENWFIEDSGKGYTLRKWTGRIQADKNGKDYPVYDFENYPPTLESCLRHYVRNKVADEHEVLELKEYVLVFKKTYDKVFEALRQTKIEKED